MTGAGTPGPAPFSSPGRYLLGAAFGLACALWSSGAAADLAAVTSQGAGKLTLIDTLTGEVLREIDLPGQPAAVAVHGNRIAAVSVGTKRLHLFDLSGREIATADFDGAPFGVAFSAKGDILVSDAAGQGALHRFTSDLKRRTSRPAAPNPTGLDAEGVGPTVVAARDADLALIYPADCPTCPPKSVAVGHHPFGVTLHEGRAYVTNVLSNDVSVIDLVEARETLRLPTGERPYAVAFAAGKGFVTNQYDASVTVFDAQSHTILGTLETAEYPEGIAATSEGHIVVANWLSDLVQIFDAKSLALLHEIEVPEGPRAFGRFVTLNPAP